MIPHFAAEVLNTVLRFLPGAFLPSLPFVDYIFLIPIFGLSLWCILSPFVYPPASQEFDQDWWEELRQSQHSQLIIPRECFKKIPPKSYASSLGFSSLPFFPRRAPYEGTEDDVDVSAKKSSKSKGRCNNVSDVSAPVKNITRSGSGGRKSNQKPENEVSKENKKQEENAEDFLARIDWEKECYGVSALPEDVTPLVVFINGRSGGNQGHRLLSGLRKLLNPLQVFDITDREQPKLALRQFSGLPRLRILVCGGDGTVGWVLKELQSLQLPAAHKAQMPPIAVLPLGTGNDMARVLGWGPGFENKDRLEDILLSIQHAHVVMLDRWTLKIERNPDMSKKKQKQARSSSSPREITIHNYFSIGVDAQTALRFHSNRESKPELFFSRFINKLWYMMMGTKEIWKNSCADLPEQVTLICDGKEVAIPAGSEGIIFANINSFAGGVCVWETQSSELGSPGRRIQYSKTTCGKLDVSHPQSTGEYGPASFQDGKLEVVAVNGALHLGQLQVGLSKPVKICQCQRVELITKRPFPMQVDGEPWAQEESHIKITCQADQSHMLAKTEASGGEIATEMANLLEWAVNSKVIDENQRNLLLREFSRRIEARSLMASSKPKRLSMNMLSTIRSSTSANSLKLSPELSTASLRRSKSMYFS